MITTSQVKAVEAYLGWMHRSPVLRWHTGRQVTLTDETHWEVQVGGGLTVCEVVSGGLLDPLAGTLVVRYGRVTNLRTALDRGWIRPVPTLLDNTRKAL